MLWQLVIGGVLITTTVFFQAVAFDGIIHHARRLELRLRQSRKLWKASFLAIIVLAVSTVLIIEIWMWALLYLLLSALPDFSTALYFSTTSFTTVGFGDVVLPSQWKMLGAIEATNGFLLFGWSTAFIFEIVSIIYRKEARDLER